MKGIEKLTSVRLAEILTERGVISSEVITDALYAQDRHGEPFVQILVTGGHITEWDLAKVVTEHFNLPFLMASNYQISDDAKKRLPREVLFQHTMVPLDVFDDIVCVAMPVMLSFEEICKIQKETSCDLYPYVGLISENKKVLTDMHKDYPQWLEAEAKRRDEDAKRRAAAPSPKQAGDWMSIFDAGDMATKEPKKKPEAAKPSGLTAHHTPLPPKPGPAAKSPPQTPPAPPIR